MLGELNTTVAAVVSYSTCCANTVAGSHETTRATTTPAESPSRPLTGDSPTLEQSELETAPHPKVFLSRPGPAWTIGSDVLTRKRNPSSVMA